MAREFSGTTQYLESASESALSNIAAFSLAAWVWIDTGIEGGGIIAKRPTGTTTEYLSMMQGYAVVTGINEALCVVANGGNTFGSTDEGLIATGSWHHWCMVYNGGGADNAARLKFYFDGAAKTLYYTGTIPATTATSTAALGIGLNRQNPVKYTDGKISEAGVWLTNLSAGEAAALAAGVNPMRIRPLSLLAYWPLWGIHSPEIDVGSGTYSMTVTGATVATTDAPVEPYSRRMWLPNYALIPAAAGNPWYAYAQM